MLVKIKNARLAFPALFEAKSFEGSAPAYSATLILEGKHDGIKAIEDAMAAVAKEKWGTKADATLKDLKNKEKVCLRNGDEKSDYDGFAGNMYVSARNKSRPLVIDRDKTPLTSADGKPYGGSYCNVNIDVWCQDNQFGKRINATLLGVQFSKDGDAFSGSAPATEDDFDSEEDTDGLV